MELLHVLNSCNQEFTPIPFWFLNGDLKKKELCRQLADFAAHGVYGVVLHPRMGLAKRIVYLGDSYFGYIKTAVEEAAKLGMTVVLYDEGMYPSGSACGQVVKDHPEFASQGLVLTKVLLGGDEKLAETKDGILAVRKSGGTLRGLHWGEDDGEPNAPASADILNPDAVNRFIALTHEAYYQELKPYFGSTILGFFTDEPSILGRNVSGMFPWTQGFGTIFTEAGGNLEGLAGLFFGEENADTALYQRLLLQREGEVYYGSLSKWCEEHGIALMGHPHQSDDIEVEKYFHIPGQDLVLRWIAPEKGGLTGIDSTMAKCSADAARLMGRRRNANECFGACNKNNNPWQLSGGDMKWYLDWLAVRGVNLFIPHAFYYSIAGKRKEERPPDVGPNSIWWPHYRMWSDYMRRLSCLMTDAELHADVAVLCENRSLKPEKVRPLFERQIGFQYLPKSIWEECREEAGELVCRGRKYRAVIGENELFPAVPHLLDGWAQEGTALAAAGVRPDCICEPACSTLRTAHITRAGAQCWLLVNEGDTVIKTRLTLPVRGPVGQYHLWKGEAQKYPKIQEERLMESLTERWNKTLTESQTANLTENPAENQTSLYLELPVRGSLLLFSCTEKEYEHLPERACAWHLECPKFTLVEEQKDRAQKVYTASLSVSAEMVLYGQITMNVEAEEMAQLTVNGGDAGVSFWSPHEFDLTGLVQEGENTLCLTVTGSMANLYGKESVWYGVRQ